MIAALFHTDLSTTSILLADAGTSTNIVDITVAAVGALGLVVASYISRRNKGAETKVVINTAETEPVIRAAAESAVEGLADVYRDDLARERREKDELVRQLDAVRADAQRRLDEMQRRLDAVAAERDDYYRRLYSREGRHRDDQR